MRPILTSTLAALALVMAACSSGTAPDGGNATTAATTAPSAATDDVSVSPGTGSPSAPSGEATDAGGDQPTVSLVTAYYASAATKEVLDLFAASDTAADWDVPITDTNGDFSRLNSAMQDAVAQDVDAIVIGMGDPNQMGVGIEAANEAGIPVFSIDAAATEGIIANVTSDNVDLGRRSAEWLADNMPAEASVLMFTHDPHPGVRARAEAARAVFDERGIKVVDAIHVEVPGPVDSALTSMQDYLTANPTGGAQGVWAGWDEPALGATQAIQAADVEDVTVVGVDGQPFALDEIAKSGPFGATVAQDWESIADRTAELVATELDGGNPEQGQVEIPGELVTADDL